MNDKEILEKAKGCLSKRTTRKSEEDYKFLINFLVGILASHEAQADSTKDFVAGALENLKRHTNLAIVKGGKVCEIDCNIAARHGVTVSSNACSGMFPVMRMHEALLYVNNGEIPERGFEDKDTSSIVTKRLFYKRNPEQLVFLSQQDINELRLGR